MDNNCDSTPTPKPKSNRGRKPGSKDTKPRKPRCIGSKDGQKGSTSKPKAAVVPAWVENRGLKPKQALFIAEYMVDLNGKAAAIRAGWSPVVASRVAHELIHLNRKTSKAIKEALEARQARTGITADRILLEISNIAFGRATDVMDWGPGGVVLRDSSSLPHEVAALISEVSETKPTDGGGGSVKVKTYDRMKALEMLGRHLGIFQDQVINRVQVQDVPAAAPGSPEAEKFSAIMASAKERWKQQGFLGASRQG